MGMWGDSSPASSPVSASSTPTTSKQPPGGTCRPQLPHALNPWKELGVGGWGRVREEAVMTKGRGVGAQAHSPRDKSESRAQHWERKWGLLGTHPHGERLWVR